VRVQVPLCVPFLTKEKDMTKTEKHLFWLLIEFQIHRYLLANTRLNGFEKAEQHIDMSALFVALKLLITSDGARRHHWKKVMAIHDYTQKLTDNLDTEIGFPIGEEVDDINYEQLSRKFFNKFLLYANECWETLK
jgi:hypothetical protein